MFKSTIKITDWEETSILIFLTYIRNYYEYKQPNRKKKKKKQGKDIDRQFQMKKIQMPSKHAKHMKSA